MNNKRQQLKYMKITNNFALSLCNNNVIAPTMYVQKTDDYLKVHTKSIYGKAHFYGLLSFMHEIAIYISSSTSNRMRVNYTQQTLKLLLRTSAFVSNIEIRQSDSFWE